MAVINSLFRDFIDLLEEKMGIPLPGGDRTVKADAGGTTATSNAIKPMIKPKKLII